MKLSERMRKLLSILLCICMLVQNAPVMVFASEADGSCEHTSYSEETVPAGCTTPSYTKYTCDSCGYSYNEYLSYSEWSTDRPTGIADELIETATQYRSAEIDIQTSSESSMDGYTLTGTTWTSTQETNDYADFTGTGFDTTSDLYAQYQHEPVYAYEDDSRKIVVDSEATTGYLYYHWCYAGNPYTTESKEGSYTTFHASYNTTNPDSYKYLAADDSYQTDIDCGNSVWWWVLDVKTQTYTVSELVNVFEKQGAWSEWGFTEIQETDTCVVETREVYRYANGETAHSYGTDGKCTGCGADAPRYTAAAVGDAYGQYTSPYISLSNTTAIAGQDFTTVLNYSVGSGVKVFLVFHASKNHLDPIRDYTYDAATRTLTVPAKYITEGIKIYAYPTVAVTLDGNGGTLAEGYTAPVIVHKSYNSSLGDLPTDVYTREGMYITGWLDSEGNSYTGGRVGLKKDVTMYAQWSCYEHGDLVYKALDKDDPSYGYRHDVLCTACGTNFGRESHDLGVEGVCVCGYKCSDHKIIYTDSGDGTHKGTCETCGTEVSGDHTPGESGCTQGDGTHSFTCGLCGAAVTEEHSYSKETGFCLCGAECEHNFVGGVCNKCGYACKHPTDGITQEDYSIDWDNDRHYYQCKVCHENAYGDHDYTYDAEYHVCICRAAESFDYKFVVDGSTESSGTVTYGATLNSVVPYIDRDGYYIIWCSDEALTKAYNLTTPVTSDITLYAKWVQHYDLYIQGILVDELNKDDILDDGTVSFDPTTNTLTLNNANIQGNDSDIWSGESEYGIYYYGRETLTIDLKGDNTVDALSHTSISPTAIDITGNLVRSPAAVI